MAEKRFGWGRDNGFVDYGSGIGQFDEPEAAAVRWPRLSLKDIDLAGADRKLLAGRIAERYGISMELALRQVDDRAAPLPQDSAMTRGVSTISPDKS